MPSMLPDIRRRRHRAPIGTYAVRIMWLMRSPTSLRAVSRQSPRSLAAMACAVGTVVPMAGVPLALTSLALALLALRGREPLAKVSLVLAVVALVLAVLAPVLIAFFYFPDF